MTYDIMLVKNKSETLISISDSVSGDNDKIIGAVFDRMKEEDPAAFNQRPLKQVLAAILKEIEGRELRGQSGCSTILNKYTFGF